MSDNETQTRWFHETIRAFSEGVDGDYMALRPSYEKFAEDLFWEYCFLAFISRAEADDAIEAVLQNQVLLHSLNRTAQESARLTEQQTTGILRCLGQTVTERWLEKYYSPTEIHHGPIRLPEHLAASPAAAYSGQRQDGRQRAKGQP